MPSHFWSRLQLLCLQRGASPSAIAKRVGLSNAAAVQWKKGSVPNKNTLQKLADYFSVTPDYLLGYGDADELPTPSPLPEPEGFKTAAYVNGLDDEDLELLLKIKALEGEDAVMMRNFLQYLLDKKEKKNSDAGEI